MSETTPPTTAPQEAATKASRLRIILMLALGGPVLAVGGCALFLANLNFEGSRHGSDTLSAVGAIVFAGGCLAFVAGVLWAVARFVDRRFARAAVRKAAEQQGSDGG